MSQPIMNSKSYSFPIEALLCRRENREDLWNIHQRKNSVPWLEKDENNLFEREAQIDFHVFTFLQKLLIVANHMGRNETWILSYLQPLHQGKAWDSGTMWIHQSCICMLLPVPDYMAVSTVDHYSSLQTHTNWGKRLYYLGENIAYITARLVSI